MTRSKKNQPPISENKNSRGHPLYDTPFNTYFHRLDQIDKGKRYSKEYGSILILGLVEEIGEMARAYLAEHGRKKNNLAAQQDETYEQELGDILVSILRFARIKNINLHERILYTLQKIEKRKIHPKEV
ncbi:MAG TPA: MazG nucleotide pyrophosphohydrolase domain-containing protein [Candidatus Woesebacteria bacterium]|nr:MazG nucleotide pyrophosphohydrolase domain-containing protein [Candidatus Woesebacteria bacterium]